MIGGEKFAAALTLVAVTLKDLPPVSTGYLPPLFASANKFNSAAGEIARRTRGIGWLRILPSPVSSLPLNVEIIDNKPDYQTEEKKSHPVSGFSALPNKKRKAHRNTHDHEFLSSFGWHRRFEILLPSLVSRDLRFVFLKLGREFLFRYAVFAIDDTFGTTIAIGELIEPDFWVAREILVTNRANGGHWKLAYKYLFRAPSRT